MKVWPDYNLDINDNGARGYSVRASTHITLDLETLHVNRTGHYLMPTIAKAITALESKVEAQRTKLPTTPGAVIQSLESNARYVLGLDDRWHSSGSQWTDEYIDFPFKVLAP